MQLGDKNPQSVDVGDPAKDPRRSFASDLPTKDFSSAKLVGIVTGHGQAYVNNARAGYNGGSHTPPYYQMSAVVVLFRQ